MALKDSISDLKEEIKELNLKLEGKKKFKFSKNLSHVDMLKFSKLLTLKSSKSF